METKGESEFIGLDVGRARTGMARGSSMARLAEALGTLPTDTVLAKLNKLNADGLAGIVVGLPRGLAGQETEQTQWVRQWVSAAKQEVKAVFYWQDEALTSKLAEAQALNNGKIKDIDSAAAQIILQDFLDSDQASRVVA